jgi:hypothetical protein
MRTVPLWDRDGRRSRSKEQGRTMPKRDSRVGRCEGAREEAGVRGSGWCETGRRVDRADVSVVERREASGRANGKRFEGEDWSTSGRVRVGGGAADGIWAAVSRQRRFSGRVRTQI